MTDYSDLVRCLRDCFGKETDEDYICDCDHCLFKDKIEVVRDDGGEEIYTDYTTCETAMVLAAADAIEELMRKLRLRDNMLTNVVTGLHRSMIAMKDIIDGGDDRIT